MNEKQIFTTADLSAQSQGLTWANLSFPSLQNQSEQSQDLELLECAPSIDENDMKLYGDGSLDGSIKITSCELCNRTLLQSALQSHIDICKRLRDQQSQMNENDVSEMASDESSEVLNEDGSSLQLNNQDFLCGVLDTRNSDACQLPITCIKHSQEQKLKVARRKDFFILIDEYIESLAGDHMQVLCDYKLFQHQSITSTEKSWTPNIVVNDVSQEKKQEIDLLVSTIMNARKILNYAKGVDNRTDARTQSHQLRVRNVMNSILTGKKYSNGQIL